MALEGTEPESSPGPSTKWREHLNIRQMDSGENKRQPPVSRKRCTDTTEISSASRSSAPVLTFGGGSGFLADGHSKAHPFSSSALPRRTDDPTAVLPLTSSSRTPPRETDPSCFAPRHGPTSKLLKRLEIKGHPKSEPI